MTNHTTGERKCTVFHLYFIFGLQLVHFLTSSVSCCWLFNSDKHFLLNLECRRDLVSNLSLANSVDHHKINVSVCRSISEFLKLRQQGISCAKSLSEMCF